MSTQAKAPVPRSLGCLRLVLVFFASLVIVFTLYWLIQLPQPNWNKLAIGGKATSPPVEISINPAIELDFKSKGEVLDLRREVVTHYPELISGKYRPSDAVFGQIVDGLPWWGMAGQFYHGRGEKSIEGAAEESRFIMNPFLLVAADFYGASLASDGTYGWDSAKITEPALAHPNFPFTCGPYSLRWWPGEARAEAVYNVSLCMVEVSYWTIQPFTLIQSHFDLVAYNARDMNLNYIYVSYNDSSNIFKPEPPGSPTAIRHFIHQGGSCGYPGGCNNMSPPTPETDGLRLIRLPARVVIWLWEFKPRSLEHPADMTFVIRFE